MVLYRSQLNGQKFSKWYQASIEDFKNYFKYKPAGIIKIQVYLVNEDSAFTWERNIGWSTKVQNTIYNPDAVDTLFKNNETFDYQHFKRFSEYLHRRIARTCNVPIF